MGATRQPQPPLQSPRAARSAQAAVLLTGSFLTFEPLGKKSS